MSPYLLFFVGSLPSHRQEELIQSIEEALSPYPGLYTQFADREPPGPDRQRGIQFAIDRSFICLIDVASRSRPQGYLELGYAQGKGRHCVLLSHARSRLAESLEGYENLVYNSPQELRHRLEEALPKLLASAIWTATEDRSQRVQLVNAGLLSIVSEALLESGRLEPNLASCELDISFEQCRMTFDVLGCLGFARPEGSIWLLTDLGSRLLPKLLAEIESRNPKRTARALGLVGRAKSGTRTGGCGDWALCKRNPWS